MKKALALILAVCMLFSCAVMVSAADAQSVTATFDSGVFDSTPTYYQARLEVDSGVIDSGDVVTATMTLTEDSDDPRVSSEDFDHWTNNDTLIMMQGNVADVDEQVTVAVSINNSKYALTEPVFEKNVITVDLVKSDNQGGGTVIGGGSGGGGSSSGSKLGIVSDKTNTGASKTLSTAAASKAASDAAAAAIADAQAAGQSSANASVTFNNVSSLSPAAIKAINDAVAAAEAKSGVGVSLTVNIDKVVNGKVVTRIALDPADLANVAETVNTTVSYDVTDRAVKSVLDRFNKYFTNDIVVVSYGEASPLAGVNAEFCAKLDLTSLNTDAIVVYSYDRATNVYTRVAAPNFFVDVNGYAHVTAPFGGSLIITDAPLTSK